jgi:hypothetical protein
VLLTENGDVALYARLQAQGVQLVAIEGLLTSCAAPEKRS